MENEGLNPSIETSQFSEFKTEIVFYLEDKIMSGIASNEELKLYEDYKWFGKLDFEHEVCLQLDKEMQHIYDNGYM